MTAAQAIDRRVAPARNATLAVFAVSGFGMASWMARVPDVREQLQLTPGLLGLLLLAISAGSLVGLPLAGRLAHRFGAAGAVRLGGSVSLVGLAVSALTTQFMELRFCRDMAMRCRSRTQVSGLQFLERLLGRQLTLSPATFSLMKMELPNSLPPIECISGAASPTTVSRPMAQ